MSSSSKTGLYESVRVSADTTGSSTSGGGEGSSGMDESDELELELMSGGGPSESVSSSVSDQRRTYGTRVLSTGSSISMAGHTGVRLAGCVGGSTVAGG